MSRAARLLALMQALRRRRTAATAAGLAAELGVSARTLYRDIATLRDGGAPIVGAAGLGYVLEPGFFLPPLALTRDEVDAVMLGLRLVARRGGPELAAAAEDALSKVLAVLPTEAATAARAAPLLAGPARVPPHIAALRSALAQERRIRIGYRDGQGRASGRVVWPIALGFFDAAEVLVAWCESRSGFRHFRLDRIAELEQTGEPMPRRRRLLLAEWRNAETIGGS